MKGSVIMNCPFCGAINSVSRIKNPDGDTFMLISKPSKGNISSPPKGILVKALGCGNCGTIILANPELAGMSLSQE